MASKGKSSINIQKNWRLEDLRNGESTYSLARKYNISRGTISNWQLKIKNPEKYLKFGKRGRPKEKDLTTEDYKERYEILKKYQAFLKAQRERK